MHRRNNSQNYKSVGPGCSSLDSVIYWMNRYPADSVIDFRNSYLLDSDLSGG